MADRMIIIMTSRDPERSRSWPQYLYGPLFRKRFKIETRLQWGTYTGWSKKNGPLVNFGDNFGKHGPILTIFSLLQQEIYGAQNLLCCYTT